MVKTKKELVDKLIPIEALILELEYLNINTEILKQYDLGCRVNCYDILDDNNYLIKNLYEVIDEEGNVISSYTNKDFKKIK